MRHKLSLILTLSAWFFATGSHWDIVQAFAWGKMFTTYSQSMSYADAVKLTFATDNLCDVCELVADAEQSSADGENAPGKSGVREIQLNFTAVPQIVIAAPDSAPWSPSDLRMPPPNGAAPPSPPPRA
jgi:hypothetical protein